MAVSTNAIGFIRAGALPDAEGKYKMEIYTDATSSVVDTQITAVDSDGTFTGGTFSGVVCKYAQKFIGCTVNNVLNDGTTTIITPGTITTIFGSAPGTNGVDASIYSTTTMPLVNGVNNHNVPVVSPVANITGHSASASITGFSGGVDGMRITLVNAVAQDVVFVNQSASSSAANRIVTATGADVTMTAAGRAELLYDGTAARWNLLYCTA